MPVAGERILPDGVLERLPDSWPGWGLFWLGLLVGIILTGSVIGGVLYPLVGSLIGMELGLLEMLRKGLFDGGFYALIWAPALSFVFCLIGAHEKKVRNRRDLS